MYICIYTYVYIYIYIYTYTYGKAAVRPGSLCALALEVKIGTGLMGS